MTILGNRIHYTIYDKFETVKTDVSSTRQETNGRHELTLVTCNAVNGNRIIVKAVR
ncbi:MAG: sortase [Oscillospiraceae bacterium]|nr:sortase [Oscillospiraceae bacterium]